MNSKSKFAAVAIVVAVGVATTAGEFTQALQTGTAADREQLYGYGSSPSQFVGRQPANANDASDVFASRGLDNGTQGP